MDLVKHRYVSVFALLFLIAGTLVITPSAEAASVKSQGAVAKAVAAGVKKANPALASNSCLSKATKAAAKAAAKKNKATAGVKGLRSAAVKCGASGVKVVTVKSALNKRSAKTKAAAWKKINASKANRAEFATAAYDKVAVSAFSRGKSVFTVIALIDTTPASVVPPMQVGAAYAGGIYAGTTQDEYGKQYALVASPRSMQFAPSALSPYLYWDRDNYNSSTGTYRAAPKKSEWDGLANTQSGAAVDGGYMIFNHVINMTAPNDGGSAWYVPAKNELNLLWQSLGEAGLAFDYVKDGSTYVVWWLWSSTERTSGADAWYQIVRGTYGGNQNDGLKDSSNNYYGVRPVRRVAL